MAKNGNDRKRPDQPRSKRTEGRSQKGASAASSRGLPAKEAEPPTPVQAEPCVQDNAPADGSGTHIPVHVHVAGDAPDASVGNDSVAVQDQTSTGSPAGVVVSTTSAKVASTGDDMMVRLVPPDTVLNKAWAGQPESNPHARAGLAAGQAEVQNSVAGMDLGVAELQSLITEPMPGPDVDRIQREMFVKRQYRGEQTTKTLNALFQVRMGMVLLGLKAEVGHGKWEAYVESAFPFKTRSAVEYMDLARQVNENEASKCSLYDLRVKLGKSKQGSAEVSETLDSAVETLKKLWQTVLKLGAVDSPLMRSLRRLQRPDPDVDTLLKLVEETSISLTSLAADLKQKKQAAAEWAEKHPSKKGDEQ